MYMGTYAYDYMPQTGETPVLLWYDTNHMYIHMNKNTNRIAATAK